MRTGSELWLLSAGNLSPIFFQDWPPSVESCTLCDCSCKPSKSVLRSGSPKSTSTPSAPHLSPPTLFVTSAHSAAGPINGNTAAPASVQAINERASCNAIRAFANMFQDSNVEAAKANCEG